MSKKILIPWDGSELATRILPEVERIAQCSQADIVLFNVGSLSTAATKSELITFQEINEISAQMKSAAGKAMTSITEEMKKRRVKAVYAYTEVLWLKRLFPMQRAMGAT